MKTFIKMLFLAVIIVVCNSITMADLGDITNRMPLSSCSFKKDYIISQSGLNADILPSTTNKNTTVRFGNLKKAIDLKKTSNGELITMVTAYGSTDVENKYFAGSFKCNDDSLIVAILSDDGVTVRIKSAGGEYGDDKICRFNYGQALPDTGTSLQLLDGAWTPGETYTLEIDYSNTCYLSENGDIDGLSVFFCGDVDFVSDTPIEPEISSLQLSFNQLIYPCSLIDQTSTATATINYSNVGNITKNWNLNLKKLDGTIIASKTVPYDRTKTSIPTTFDVPVPKQQGIYDYKVDVDTIESNTDSIQVTSVKATSLSFHFNDNPSVYTYTGQIRDVTATVDISIDDDGTNTQIKPSWTITINGPDPNNWLNIIPVASVPFIRSGTYTNATVSISLPAVAKAYTYTASLTSGYGTATPVLDSASVVAVALLEYKIGTGDFTVVPEILYVAKGTAVTFKAIPKPAGIWPSSKPVWGGTSGFIGTGETKSVIFNTAGTFTVTSECGNMITVNITVVKVNKLQYENNGTYTDVPNPLYIPLSAATVTFKAIPSSTGGWPDSKPVWGGTSGAIGTDETTEVTFPDTGEYTVTAECGDTVTVTIVVYTIDLSTTDEVPIAVGGVANAPHQKTIKATLRPILPNPSGVTFSIMGDTGVNIAASLSSTDPVPFNKQGEAEVTLTSSDYLEDIIVKGEFMDETEQMTVQQEVWKYYTFSFTYHENTIPITTDIEFKIAQQENGQIPLQGHDIHFSIVDVYANIEGEMVQVQPSEWANYAVLQNPNNDITDNNGTANSVIEWGEGDSIVYIQGEDYNVYIPSN